MAFKIVEIIDGETIKVIPNWVLTTPDGTKLKDNKLKIKGYKISNSAYSQYAIDKLRKLLTNKELVIKNPELLNSGDVKIACSVFVDDVDVSNYFPEYKSI